MANERNEEDYDIEEQQRRIVDSEAETPIQEDDTRRVKSEQEPHGEHFGNNYGFGREGSYVAPADTTFNTTESEYVTRYEPPGYSELFVPDGPQSGRGPKNCGEPTGTFRDDICVRLTQNGQLDASEIEIEVDDTVVILSGSVKSEDDRDTAERIAAAVQGVSRVENRLSVEA